MKNTNRFMLSSATLAVLTLMNQAHAQQAADAASPAPANAVRQATSQDAAVKEEVQQIVVTGVAGGGAKRKLDSGYSITTATEEQIKEANATSTADLIKIVPGIYVESTGGQSGANMQIRGFPSAGDSPYVTLAVNGTPVFPQSSLSFMANDALFRMDDLVQRAEVTVGGPQSLFSNGQFGATMDFQLKTGTDTPEGSLRVTTGTGSLQRYDMFYSGKISDGWYGAIAGYYENDYGVRDAGFPAVDGGQLSATLMHKLNDGQITFYARSTSENDAFYTSVPLLQNPTTGAVSAFPGFNPLTGTFENGEIRLIAPPGGQTADLEQGRGLHGNLLGMNLDQKIDGWYISDKAGYTNASIPTIAMFSGATPQTMGAFNAANGGGTATYIDNGAAVDPNQQVITNSLWIIQKKIESFSNQFQMSKELFKNHTVAFGLYADSYSSNDNWDIGNPILQEVSSGRPINVVLNSGSRLTNSGGYIGGAAYLLNESGNAQDTAVFIHDDWKITDKFDLNAGVRTERSRVDLTTEVGGVAANPNPQNLYDTGNHAFSAPGTSTAAFNDTFHLNSYMVGGNYKLAKDTSVFASESYGGSTPNFDELRGTDPASPPPNTTVRQFEVGFKTATSLYSAYVTVYQNKFDNLFLAQILNSGAPQNTTGNAHAAGLTYELAVRPMTNLQIALSGDLQRAYYVGYNNALNPNINGNAEVRQPNEQFRLTPSYSIPLGDNTLKFYGTWSYVGLRYSDQQSTQILPSYQTIDAGAILEIGEKLEFRLTGTNLTNELGITEGNVHATNSGTLNGQNLVIGRPLFGREINLSAMYRF
jgi:iron complex outermembrane receptor protein